MDPEPMFLNPGGFHPQGALLVIGIVGLVVGFAWIRRIVGSDPDREPSSWRYRKVRRPREWPTIGWLATRLGMTLAAVVLVAVVTAPATGLTAASPVWLAAVAMAAIGTVWTFRIARPDPEAGTPPWRYRAR